MRRICFYAAGWTFQGIIFPVPSTLVCVAYHPVFLVHVPPCLVWSTGWWVLSMQPGHPWGAGMSWWTQRRVLIGWPPLTCSKLGSCHHNTGRLYVMPYPQALTLRIRVLLGVAGLEPGVVHELGRLPLRGRRRIRGWCNALWSCRGSTQIPGYNLLLVGNCWYWVHLYCLPFFVPWVISTAPQSSWSPRSTIYWQWWCLFRWYHSIVLCHTRRGVAYGTFLRRRRVVLGLLLYHISQTITHMEIFTC